MSARHDMRKALRECERAGLVIEHRGKHPKIRDPRTGRAVSVSSSPSDCHAYKNALRDVRRYLGIALSC